MSKPTMIEVMKSVIAAAVGIQSDKNRKQDFQHGSLAMYVVGGMLFTLTFIGAIILIVSMVL